MELLFSGDVRNAVGGGGKELLCFILQPGAYPARATSYSKGSLRGTAGKERGHPRSILNSGAYYTLSCGNMQVHWLPRLSTC